MQARTRLLVSGVLAAIITGVGFVDGDVIPGVGPTPTKNFTDFYQSDSQQHLSVVLFLVLTIGCLLMLWFFTELRSRLGEGTLMRLGFAAAVVGVVALPIGAAVMGGPTGAMQNLDGASIDPSLADSFAQAGLLIMLLPGMGAFALAMLMANLAARRAGLMPTWLFWVGVALFVISLGSFFWIPAYAFMLWVLLTAIVVGMRPEAAARPGAIA